MKGIKKCIVLAGFMCSILVTTAQNLNNPNKLGPLGTEVNTISGNLFIPRTDFVISARAFDIDITFYYNSYLLREDMGFGNGWSFLYDIQYSSDTVGGRIIRWGDGREDIFDSIPGGGYKAPRGFFNNLVQYQPGKYRLREPDSTLYFFDNPAHGKITKLQEPNGNFINFNYTDSLLTSLTNGAGQSLTFTYNANGRLASIVDAVTSPTRTYTYTYDEMGNLKEVKDPLNGKTTYTYLLTGPMKTLADRNNNVVDIIYYPDYSTKELIGCNKRLSFSYDTLTKKTIVTDHFDNGSANQVTTYVYERTDNIAWITSMSGNCCGFNLNYEYDDQGNPLKITDANGQIYNYTYDDKGNVLTMKDPLGQIHTYTYSSDYNKLTSYKDPKGIRYSLSYDSKGNLVQLTAPSNIVYTASYNTSGDIISSTDPRGNTFTYNYDAYGNPITVTGPNGYHASLSYDARGNLLSYIDARGNSTSAEYDILGRLKKITDPINNKLQYNYDANGNITSLLNKNNETSIFDYDASNRLVTATDPTGRQFHLGYDAMDKLTRVKNALGYETRLFYDTRNRLSGIRDAENNSSTMEYDPNGNLTGLSLPNGRVFHYTFDALNRLTAISDQKSTLISVSYDKNGNITSYTNSMGAVTTAIYDSLNRIKQITDPLGNSTVCTYDKNSNITSITDRNGHTSQITYDSLDRMKTFTDKNNFVITIGYDAMSNIVSLTDQNNNTTTYTYDSLNRRKRMTYPDGTFTEYTYNNKGNIISRRLTDGTSISYQYDTLNRIIAKTLPGGQTYTYAYDLLGRVISATSDAGTVTLTYDALNRITLETFDGRTTSYQYNVAGRTQKMIYPDGATVLKEYDTRNRLVKILKDSVVVVEYVYNNADQLTGKTFANGVSSTYQYDFANRLSNITTAGGSIQNTSFNYDNELNKTEIIRNNNPALSEQFSYDNGYRLTSYKRGPVSGTPSVQNTYSYDAVGNRTSANLNGVNTNYTVNNLNQVTASTGGQNIAFTYDSRGNLTYDGVFYKTYDAEGRLLKDSSSPANVISYRYDAFNRRVIKNSNGSLLKYTYSGPAQIEERDGSNNILNKTIFTSFISPVMNEKNGKHYYYHQNELNSVEAITNDAGRLAERYQYDVYGKPSRFDSLNNNLASSVAGNRFGFTGQEYDSASGSYRFFYRNYSPGTGLFNQRDLIEYQDGMGMYQYAGDNPANGIDVWGLDCGGGATTATNKTTTKKKRSEEAKEVFDKVKKVREYEKKVEKLEFINKDVKAGLSGYGTALDIVLVPAQITVVVIEGDEYMQGYDKKTTTQKVEGAFDLTVDATGAGAGTVVAVSGLGMGIGEALVSAVAAGVATTIGEGVVVVKGIDNVSQQVLNNMYDPGASVESAQKVKDKLTRIKHKYKDRQFIEHEKYLQEVIREYGTDRSTWSQEALEVYEIHEMDKKKRQQQGDDCPPTGGTRRPKADPNFWDPVLKFMEILGPHDPNEIIGPEGQPDLHWVSVKDRMPYTILFENAADEATAPAKFVRITTPIEPKQDIGTFELGSFGFNTTTFTVPPNTSAYYNRLDVRDSIGLYVDITAGYDPVNKVAFWEFQSIDPVTLQPPSDPFKGLLLLQDSNSLANGHGFVNFTIKPKQSSITRDTIGARAQIVFDLNDTIPTNIYTNTIDAFAPTSHLNSVTSLGADSVKLAWSGVDDTGGCGINYYSIYVSNDQVNYTLLFPFVRGTDTSFTLPPDSNYCFFVLATDRVGNAEVLRPGETQCASIGGPGPLPVTWLYFNGSNQGTNNFLKWATASEQNSKEFRLERSLNGSTFNQIAVIPAAGNSSTTRQYQYTDPNIDRLGSNIMFYRLKQVDIDDHFVYSSVVKLNYNNTDNVHSVVYPNPNNGNMSVLVGDSKLIGTDAVVVDINGKLISRVRITAMNQSFDLTHVLNGVYFIRLANNETLKIIKQ